MSIVGPDGTPLNRINGKQKFKTWDELRIDQKVDVLFRRQNQQEVLLRRLQRTAMKLQGVCVALALREPLVEQIAEEATALVAGAYRIANTDIEHTNEEDLKNKVHAMSDLLRVLDMVELPGKDED